MATKTTGTRRKRTTTSPAKKRMTKKQLEEQARARKQLWAVILFALGLLFAALTFIKGGGFWNTLHDGLFGFFGFAAYLIAPILLYIAVMATLERPIGSIHHKIWQVGVLMLLICGALQVAGAGAPDAQGFEAAWNEIFAAGVARKGGGIAGAVFGLPLLGMFEKTGALIILGLLIFVFVMLITGSTLIGLFQTAAKPVKKLEQAYTETVEQTSARREEKRQETSRRRFNIDIPLDPDPPKKAEKSTATASANTQSSEQPSAASQSTGTATAASEHKALESNAYIDDIIKKMVANQKQPEPAPAPEPSDGASLQAQAQEPPAEDQPDSQEESLDFESQEVLIKPVEEKVYTYPPVTLLTEPTQVQEDTPEELKANAQRLVDTLQSFGVQTRIIDICRGPAVTRYELQPSAGVKISRITGLADDIALNLAASGVRIEAPIPGKPAVGIEIPNKSISTVTLREIVDSNTFSDAKSKLTIALGRDIAGNITVADVAKMPHMLIAGATGSGKSVCINSIIMSLLFKASDKEVKFLMIDPKVVELGIYNGIPHLLVPVVTDPKKAAGALNWAVSEMLNRYKTFAENSVRDLSSYNALAQESDTLVPMPQIVIIIDELSDLMMAAPSEVEDAICRLAQMARAAGMHLVIATQRPSVDVITGVIKANIPSRIAFAVSSQVDSRTILDAGGAEKLLGRGDMLFYPVGSPKPVRVQGCFVSDKEVERVVEFIKEGEKHQYDQQIMEEIERQVPAGKGGSSGGGESDGEESDEMLPEAIECVIETGQASTSFLQRRLKVGYARAGRLIDAMEQMGIVGPFEGSKPRQVLISKERWYEMKLNQQEKQQLQ